MATRGRPTRLREAVASLMDFAQKPGLIEVLLRVDADDISTVKEASLIADPLPGATVVVGERWGYQRLHMYWNQLAALSRGDWLLVFNDDALMLTRGWDDLLQDRDALVACHHSLSSSKPQAIQFLRRDVLPFADRVFAAVSREVYEAMGHLSRTLDIDNWLATVAETSGLGLRRDDVVYHHTRPVDATTEDRIRALAVNGSSTYESEREVMATARTEDARRTMRILRTLEEDICK